MHVEELRPFAGHEVRIRLANGTELEGELRTELLTDQSISVYLAHAGAAGGTVLYIDEIAEVSAHSA